MPLYYSKSFTNGSRISIWQITESLPELLQLGGISQDELNQSGKKNVKRQLEWITIRMLLKKLLNTNEKIELVYDKYGKPHLHQIKKHFSISHTRQFVAVIVNENKKAGIDIEMIAPRIENIKHKFLGEEESKWSQGNNQLEKL